MPKNMTPPLPNRSRSKHSGFDDEQSGQNLTFGIGYQKINNKDDSKI